MRDDASCEGQMARRARQAWWTSGLALGTVSDSRPTLPLRRGTFYQGYLCTTCGVGAHKECLEVTPPCKISE